MTSDRLDVCLRLVSNRYRRRIIHRLRHEIGGTTTVDDLVEQLHSSDSISIEDRCTNRDRIFVALVHNHLPKLADHGLVDYDPERGTVRYQPDEQIETVLDSLPDEIAPLNR